MTFFFLTAGCYYLIKLGCLLFLCAEDPTDGVKKRSQLLYFKDHGTGVEYVGTMFGGITPRLQQQENSND